MHTKLIKMTAKSKQIRQELTSAKACDLIEMLDAGEVKIPNHQRASGCWNEKLQKGFIKTVQQGMPTPAILQRKKGNDVYLEDGLQRLTTLRKYRNNEFKDHNGMTYEELSPIMKNQVDNYQVAIIRYSNATDQQAIEIFDNVQNGVPLSAGQRMDSLRYFPSPIVQQAYRLLLTKGQGIHDRASLVWGERCELDKKRNDLVVAVAMISGVRTRNPEKDVLMTKKWDDIREDGLLYYEVESDDKVCEKLSFVLSIHEEVISQRGPITTRKHFNQIWDLGNFNGPIIWSMSKFPEELTRLRDGWVKWLVSYRDKPDMLKEYKDVISADRVWKHQRWESCYNYVFGIPNKPSTRLPLTRGDDDEDSDE